MAIDPVSEPDAYRKVVAACIRWIAAEHEPDIIGYDQDLWVSGLRQVDERPGTLLGAFAALRGWSLDFWARLPVGDRDRIGVHRERGAARRGAARRASA